jgi:hypothetical protein
MHRPDKLLNRVQDILHKGFQKYPRSFDFLEQRERPERKQKGPYLCGLLNALVMTRPFQI